MDEKQFLVLRDDEFEVVRGKTPRKIRIKGKIQSGNHSRFYT